MLIRRMPLILAVVAMFALVAVANATVVIKTNDGSGADAELRESSQSTDLSGTVDPAYQNRGASTEIATRVSATGRRSSVTYLKFDISGLPAIGDSFWTTNKQAIMRVRQRNNDRAEARFRALRPGATSDSTNPNDWNYDASATTDQAAQMEFAIYGLDPNGTYANDPGGSGMKMDRSGNSYATTQSKYEWNEGDSSNGSGITFYDAPGVTPHCMFSGSCDTAEYGGDATNTEQSRGYIDDFNSNVVSLGTMTWPEVWPANHMPAGAPMDFSTPAVFQLVKDAKAAGRESVTLIVSHGMDPLLDGVPIVEPPLPDPLPEDYVPPATDPNGLPHDWFNYNYLMMPKEMLQVAIDSNYDPDGSGPLPSGPGPFSGMSNATGQFSPQLIITVPEPSSLLLIGLAVAGLAMVGRRK